MRGHDGCIAGPTEGRIAMLLGATLKILILAVIALLPVAGLFWWGVQFAENERQRDRDLDFQMRTDHEVSP
jgi:hypothetical protein